MAAYTDKTLYPHQRPRKRENMVFWKFTEGMNFKQNSVEKFSVTSVATCQMIQKRQYGFPLVIVYRQPVLFSLPKEWVQSPKT